MFEQIRQILNFETDETKLLTIVMAGQVELRYKLADKSKRALVSRIAVSSTLDALTLQETGEMIEFRCRTAKVDNPFEPDAVESVYQWSKGVPREAIKLCAMSVQYAEINRLSKIPADLVEVAAADIVRPADELEHSERGTMRATRRAV
jgi:general secretion pathway protein A